MLSLFPSLFTWSFLGISFLRVVLALALASFAFPYTKESWRNQNIPQTILGAIGIIAAILLFIGLFTQAAALATAILIIITLVKNRGQLSNRDFTLSLLLMLALALALLVLGPGAYAIDWPL